MSLLRAALKLLCNDLCAENASLNRRHYPILINGREASEGKREIKSAFHHAFTKERNLACWKKVGAVPATRACLNDPKVRVEVLPDEFKEYIADADREYSRNDQIVETMREYEVRNHKAVAALNEMGLNGDVFKAFAPETEQRLLRETREGTDDRIRRLAVNLNSHSERFIKTGGQPLNSDDFFRAIRYQEACEEHEAAVTANKVENELFKYQEKALAVLAKNKPLQELNKKDELDHLIRFGVKLQDRRAAFTLILKKNRDGCRNYYAQHLKELVEDESLRIEKPPESIPAPAVPNIEETLLERERKRKMSLLSSLVASARPDDRTWLEKIVHDAQARLGELEGVPDEAKEGEQD